MKKVKNQLILIVFMVLVSATAFGQNPGDPGNGDPDASIPLDEGLLTVLVSGAAIGVAKLIKKKKNSNIL
jgi:hypothetical protein